MCGTKRAIEFNKSTSILTVWHQGKHTCILKCQSESKEEKDAKKDLLKTVLKIFPRLSNAKLINVGSQYYIQRGYPEVAKEFVQACTDKDIVSESRRESYNELLGFDQHSVHAVSIVKNKMDTVDPFYIYKINDCKWNGNGICLQKFPNSCRNCVVDGQICKEHPIQRCCCPHGWSTFMGKGFNNPHIMGDKPCVTNYPSPSMYGL